VFREWKLQGAVGCDGACFAFGWIVPMEKRDVLLSADGRVYFCSNIALIVKLKEYCPRNKLTVFFQFNFVYIRNGMEWITPVNLI
jgi:hypothetical protein